MDQKKHIIVKSRNHLVKKIVKVPLIYIKIGNKVLKTIEKMLTQIEINLFSENANKKKDPTRDSILHCLCSIKKK